MERIVAQFLMGLLVGLLTGPALVVFYEQFLESPVKRLKAKVFPHVFAERREQNERRSLRFYAYFQIVQASLEVDPIRREALHRIFLRELIVDEHHQRQSMRGDRFSDDQEVAVDA